MKKIINGLLYNTETADLIFNDKVRQRKYYKTKNGHYFVFYRTGEIRPKTEESIKELLGENDYEKYVELFEVPEEA